jgi:hypothetical protein
MNSEARALLAELDESLSHRSDLALNDSNGIKLLQPSRLGNANLNY